ncbi:MAG: sigma-70 family RNA polymerase sigma factor [Acidimicrobiales bacterium]|nr:MAG: sigma-70 family RNA polymerase sigma factor [Acidimicrobiales bacterium]
MARSRYGRSWSFPTPDGMDAEIFRTEWPKLVAVLVRDFGDLELAEDCAQDAFVEASTRWPVDGLPDRPGAWLTTTARRKALDQIRRSASYKTKLEELEVRAKRGPARSEGEIVDDQLALLLGCCHPALNLEAQVALTLRIVAGLTTEQIARGFLVEEATMGKRITRAKTKIRQANIPFRPVDRAVLAERLDAVRHVIYLIFTEGHASGSDNSFVRGDLCDEAAWLASLLVQLMPEDGESNALLALILLTDTRRATRVDDSGIPILLEDQDRSLWDREKIADGLRALERASRQGLGSYGLQATVASFHAVAPTFADTDWFRIVAMYDQMLARGGGSVVALNRAAALSYVDGPAVALAEMDELAADLDSYLYFHSARAELLRRLDLTDDAKAAYERALACNPAVAEAAFLRRQLESVS